MLASSTQKYEINFPLYSKYIWQIRNCLNWNDFSWEVNRKFAFYEFFKKYTSSVKTPLTLRYHVLSAICALIIIFHLSKSNYTIELEVYTFKTHAFLRIELVSIILQFIPSPANYYYLDVAKTVTHIFNICYFPIQRQ